MIISENIKLKLNLPVSNSQIEAEFKRLGLNVLRWAIIEANKYEFVIKISYEKFS